LRLLARRLYRRTAIGDVMPASEEAAEIIVGEHEPGEER
jgi:hypothetical protein